MRLLEIASAEEQIALFKLVSDSVWAALTTQQKQQAEERAAKQAAAKSKPRQSLRSKLALPKPMPIAKPLPKKPTQPQQQATRQQQTPQPQSVQIPSNHTKTDAVTTAAQNNRVVGRQT